YDGRYHEREFGCSFCGEVIAVREIVILKFVDRGNEVRNAATLCTIDCRLPRVYDKVRTFCGNHPQHRPFDTDRGGGKWRVSGIAHRMPLSRYSSCTTSSF